MITLSKNEINTGRQKELDLVKGFLMIMIVFIHSFQTIAGSEAAASNFYRVLFAAFMPTGACLFLFIMGFGSVYSRKNDPKSLAISGVKLLFFQGLSNLCYGLSIWLPYTARSIIIGVSEESVKPYQDNMYAMLTFVNIFFISGMCYLVLALYKLIKMPIWGYGVSVVIVACISPFAHTLQSSNPVLNWMLDATFGEEGVATFCFFPYLSYVFMGFLFAKLLRRLDEENKKKFYTISGLASVVIIAAWLVYVIANHHKDMADFFYYMDGQYIIPNPAKVVASCAAILLSFAIFHGLNNILEKSKFIYGKLQEYSKNISKMYAVHIGVYMFIAGLTAFCGFDVVGCLIWSVVVLIITDVLVNIYVKIEKRIKEKK